MLPSAIKVKNETFQITEVEFTVLQIYFQIMKKVRFTCIIFCQQAFGCLQRKSSVLTKRKKNQHLNYFKTESYLKQVGIVYNLGHINNSEG